ncbi:membrane-bound alkaline phosphatase-like [Helicoverpa zea]|uniref:membrane-bound alkaline phosphatase-like n=1 Tax=Helicoverpa zea TaxID=7113 RepID=UPI001F56E730|nr:membrane-bound alkaline phosphatase-like [Helicoverpa zea]
MMLLMHLLMGALVVSAVAGAVTGAGRDESSAVYWHAEAQAGIAARLARRPAERARNVIMFLGDGMSVPTLAAARTLLGQRQGATGEEAKLTFETFPTAGLVKTYCVNAQVADSACTATAYLCGSKANQGTLGLSAAVPRWDCDASTDTSQHVESIAEWALADGRDAGIVTTTRITHASPAGTFAKAANRHWENDAEVRQAGHDPQRCPDIAHQLVHNYPGNQFKVILGGGRREFIPTSSIDEEGRSGRRTDGRNLIEEWQRDKVSRNVSHRYIWNRDQLMDSYSSPPQYLLGLFENNHLQYHLQANSSTEPTLAELTEVAIRSLRRNEKGFFLFVEGGRIDHAHHDNLVELALDETLEMDKAVATATKMLSEDDSLIVVTADHAHVMTINGYSGRGNDILGPSREVGRDGVPYMTLSYANGPGFRPHVNGTRQNVTAEPNYRNLDWKTHVDVPLVDETHGGDDVAVFARGPHHSMFTGLYEQSQLPHLMAYAACIGPGRHACASVSAAQLTTSPRTFAVTVTIFLVIALRRPKDL